MSEGVGLIGIIQAGLIIAKVCEWTDISWWWVFSPTLAYIGILGGFLLAVFVIAAIADAL